MSLNVLTRGAGRPMLLLHGFTGTAGTWSGQLDAWVADHRVIAPDLLGHGGSEAPSDPARYDLGSQAADLARLLHLLDATPAVVVGYSMGARLALVLTLEHPDVVQRVVLESPSAGIADADERASRRRMDEGLAQRIEQYGLVAFVDGWERTTLFASHADLPPAVRERLRAERLSHDPLGLAASLRGAGQGVMSPLHDRLAEITLPTLVVSGARDRIGHDRALSVAEAIPGARAETIIGAGHTPHLECPDQFTDLTVDFLSTQPTSITH